MDHGWMRAAGIGGRESRLSVSTWPYDKYPRMPELKAGSRIVALDAEGPGAVSCIHATTYYGSRKGILKDDRDSAGLIIRAWYDGMDRPWIEMPFMDFLGDVGSSCGFFRTLYFSKTPHAHNFRLPMPFRKSLRIEIENTSDEDLTGYTEIQWEKLDAFPEGHGYLTADHRTGEITLPTGRMELCAVPAAGAVAAHWLQIQADDELCANGELLCEANDEVYLDDDPRIAMEHLGTEDYYGYSWGFHEVHSDFYAAILKREALPAGGALVAMLRCRDADRICFNRSCRIVMEYAHERNWRVEKARAKGGISARIDSCYYCYRAV